MHIGLIRTTSHNGECVGIHKVVITVVYRRVFEDFEDLGAQIP